VVGEDKETVLWGEPPKKVKALYEEVEKQRGVPSVKIHAKETRGGGNRGRRKRRGTVLSGNGCVEIASARRERELIWQGRGKK